MIRICVVCFSDMRSPDSTYGHATSTSDAMRCPRSVHKSGKGGDRTHGDIYTCVSPACLANSGVVLSTLPVLCCYSRDALWLVATLAASHRVTQRR